MDVFAQIVNGKVSGIFVNFKSLSVGIKGSIELKGNLSLAYIYFKLNF